jgi:hypothetical protein
MKIAVTHGSELPIRSFFWRSLQLTSNVKSCIQDPGMGWHNAQREKMKHEHNQT